MKYCNECSENIYTEGRMTLSQAFRKSCELLGYAPDVITGRSRNWGIVDARKIITNVIRERSNCKITYEQIANIMGGRNHTSIIHYQRKFKQLFDTEPDFAEKYQFVFDQIQKIV